MCYPKDPIWNRVKDVRLIVHPIMPEKFRKTEDNRVCTTTPHSAAVVVIGIRKLLVIDHQLMKKKTSSVYVCECGKQVKIVKVQLLQQYSTKILVAP